MAGAGYKLFNTGDVLTAAQVNTYLNEQTVMVFASAAARTSALTSVLAEGMVSYLQDTNAVEVYNGSAWVSLAADQTPLTTKGDLFTFSTVDARLAVGNNGDTLVADSAASTGLRWQGSYEAGKNKCINGDFSIWQRGTSFSANVYTADRWQTQTDKTLTVSRESFTAGTAPVAGYEGTFFLRQTYSAGGNYGALQTKLEDVRLFAGQTITLSYWAKADATYSNTPSISQNFGSGGSTAVGTNGTTHNITTTWTRYSSVITVPSISGKTIGTSSFLMLQPILIESAGARTIDIWGVQVEAGSVATAFQTATGTLQGELAACQRYFQRLINGADSSVENLGVFQVLGSTTGVGSVKFFMPMRVTPTISISAAGHFQRFDSTGGGLQALSALTFQQGTPRTTRADATWTSGTTAGNATFVIGNSASATLDASAEL
jgi:hypothetical protein